VSNGQNSLMDRNCSVQLIENEKSNRQVVEGQVDNQHAHTCMYDHAWERPGQEGGGGGCALPSSSSFFSCKLVNLTREHKPS
jgi:hypothetical protein